MGCADLAPGSGRGTVVEGKGASPHLPCGGASGAVPGPTLGPLVRPVSSGCRLSVVMGETLPEGGRARVVGQEGGRGLVSSSGPALCRVEGFGAGELPLEAACGPKRRRLAVSGPSGLPVRRPLDRLGSSRVALLARGGASVTRARGGFINYVQRKL